MCVCVCVCVCVCTHYESIYSIVTKCLDCVFVVVVVVCF